jgi:pentatricopeptide repeat protein
MTTSQLNVGYGLIENYAADLAVTMVFGIGYYLFKGLKNKKDEDNWTDPKQNLKNLKGKLEGALQRWQYAKTIEDCNELIKTNYEGINDPFAIINLMNKKGLLPTIDTYNALLLNCLLTNNNDAAETLREEILEPTGPVTPNVFTLNVLIKGLGLKYRHMIQGTDKQRKLAINKQFDKELMDLLHDLENRNIYMDVIAQNAILEALVDQERLDEAWSQYMNMKRFFKPDLFTYSALLKGIQQTPELSDEWLGKAFEILDEAKTSFELDDDFFNDLLEACVKFNRLDKAEELFEEMNSKKQLNEATYVIMIKGYTKVYKLDKANEMFNFIKNISTPSVPTYMMMLNAYNRCKNIDMAERLMEEMISKGVNIGASVYCAMLSGYRTTKNHEKALNLFDRVKDQENLTINFFNTVLEISVDSNKITKMAEIYEFLLINKTQLVDLFTHSIVIRGYAKSNNPSKVTEIYNSICKNYRLDEVIYNSIIDCYAKNNDEQNVLNVYADMKANNVKMSLITFSVLIKLYCNMGNCNKAFELFDECAKNDLKPNVIIYQMLIKLQVKSKFIDRAITMFRNMLINQVKADNVVYEVIIKACLEQQREKEACEFIVSAIKDGIKVEHYLYEHLMSCLECCFDLNTTEKSEICTKIVAVIKEKNVINVDKRTLQCLNGFIISNPHFYNVTKRQNGGNVNSYNTNERGFYNNNPDRNSYGYNTRNERNGISLYSNNAVEEKSIYDVCHGNNNSNDTTTNTTNTTNKPKRYNQNTNNHNYSNNKRNNLRMSANTFYEEKSIYS